MSTTPESGRNLPYSKEELARMNEDLRSAHKLYYEMRLANTKARVNYARQDVGDYLIDKAELVKSFGVQTGQKLQASFRHGQEKLMMVRFSAQVFGAALQDSARERMSAASEKLKSVRVAVADSLWDVAAVTVMAGSELKNAAAPFIEKYINAPLARTMQRHAEWASARREKAEVNRAARRAMIAMTKEKVMTGMRGFRNSMESSLRRLGSQLNPLAHLTTMKHRGDLLVLGIGPGKDMERVHQLLLNFRRSVGLENFDPVRRTIHIDNRFAAGKIDPVLAPFTADTVINTFRNEPAMAVPLAKLFAERIGEDAKILALAVRSNRAELDRALNKTEQLIRNDNLNDEDRLYVHQVALLQGVQDDLVGQQDFRYEQMLAVVERALADDKMPVEVAEIFMEKVRELQPYFKGRETRPIPAVAEDRPDDSRPGGAAPAGPRVEQPEPSTWESSTPGFGS